MRIVRRSRLLISFMLLLILGCTEQDPGEHRFSEYLEEDIRISENTGGPKYLGELFQFERIATLVQDPDTPGSLIFPGQTRRWDEKGFVMDGEGWFYVQDRGNYCIAVFDPTGSYSHSIGRRGDGPGEFAFLHLTGISDGVLEIYDESLQRITFYQTDGTLVDMLTCPAGFGRIWFNHTDDTFTSRFFPQQKAEEITRVAAGFTTFNRDGVPVGQASHSLVDMYFAYYWAGHKGGVGGHDLPFTSYPTMAYAPDRGIYLINGVDPIVWHYHFGGILVRKIILDLPVQQVTRSNRRQYTTDLEEQIAGAQGDEYDLLMAIRETLTFPQTRSQWKAITVDDHGYVWLEVPEWDEDITGQGEGCLYHILSPAGEFLGSTRAPASGRIINGRLLGVLTDRMTGKEDYIAWQLNPQPDSFKYP